MAATVLNATGNLSYTNNTGGNVRLIIYYMRSFLIPGGTGAHQITMTSGFGNSVGLVGANGQFSIGKDIAGGATVSNGISSQNVGFNGFAIEGALPTQIMLANGESITAQCTGYNIAIIPENG